MRERAKTLKEMAATTRFFFEDVKLDEKAAAKHLTPEALAGLRGVRDALAALPTFDAASIHEELTRAPLPPVSVSANWLNPCGWR